MGDEQAIHSGSDAIFASYRKVQERPEIKHKKKEKEKIARLANSDSFRELKKIIDKRMEDLTELTGITPGDTVESIGFRFLVAQTVKEYLKEIRDYPELCKKFTTKAE